MEELENLLVKASALEIFERFNDSPKEQLELAQLIFRCGIRGDEIKSDNLAVDIAAKAILKDSYLSRDNYKKRCEKNAKYGILGKKYGILGKEYGKLGGRPRKRQKDFNEIYEYIVSDEENIRCAISKDKEDRKALYKEIKAIFSSVSENNEANNKLINSVINKVKEEKDIHYMAERFACERKVKATKEELDVLEQMEELGIPNIEFQKPVFIKDENGKPYKFYIADFLDTKNKIDIEIDGGYHTTEDQKMKDSIRDDDFREMGYGIFRITNDEVNSGKALGMIKDFYRKRQIATTFNV